MILGIDTAGAVASVALVEDGEALGEQAHAHGSGAAINGTVSPRGNHAEVILPLIEALLQRAGVSLAQISGIAVSIGPGSFTGLRIGLATAKGIAYERGLPMAGVSSLHANAARAKDFDGVICSLLDARKSEVYTALFLSAGGRLTRLSDDQLASLERALVQARVKDGAGSPRFVGDGAKVYEKRIAKEFGAGSVIFAGGAVATEVARLGEERLSSRLGDDIGTLIPIYLRPSEAETKLAKNRLTC